MTPFSILIPPPNVEVAVVDCMSKVSAWRPPLNEDEALPFVTASVPWSETDSRVVEAWSTTSKTVAPVAVTRSSQTESFAYGLVVPMPSC